MAKFMPNRKITVAFRIRANDWIAIRSELMKRGLRYGPLIRKLLMRELGLPTEDDIELNEEEVVPGSLRRPQ
jgi:hypothetical protein